MNSLQISKISIAKISPIQQNISKLILNDLGLSGGFGNVYQSNFRNYDFAVKIFNDDGSKHGYKTINNLISKINTFESNATKSLKSINALKALPLFSFGGTFENKKVKGYVTYFLNQNNFISFDKILTDRYEYNKLNINNRLKLVQQFCKGVLLLEKLAFVHADINSENILIDIKHLKLVIIDFDSGAITDGDDHIPSTFGKTNDWVAPEIRQQLVDKEKSIVVNIQNDRYSVMVGIHYLIFLQSPYCFLKNTSNKTMKSYIQKYEWPNIPSAKETYFHKDLPSYRKLVNNIRTKEPNIFNALTKGLNNGYFNAGMRISYHQLLSKMDIKNKQPSNSYKPPKADKTFQYSIVAIIFFLIIVMYNNDEVAVEGLEEPKKVIKPKKLKKVIEKNETKEDIYKRCWRG